MFAPDAFEHLRPKAKFYEHVLDGVHYPPTNPKPIVLHLVYCGRGTAYWNAIMKFKPLADPNEASKRAAGKLAELGIVGWSNVGPADSPAEYTAERGEQLLSMLVDANRAEIVDRSIAVAMTPDNFTETPAVEAGELGKK